MTVADRGAVVLAATEQRKLTRRDAERSRALAALSTSLAEAIGDTDDVLDRIVRLIAEWMGDAAVIRMLEEDGKSMRVVAAYDAEPKARKVLERALRSTPTDLAKLAAYAAAMRDAKPVLLTGRAFDDATEVMEPASRRASVPSVCTRL